MVDEAVKVIVDPNNQLKKYFRSLSKSVDDLSFSMGESARIIKKGNTANFTLKGAGKYQALSDKYGIRKQILAPGAPILVGANKGSTRGGSLVSGGGASGKMRDSVLGATSDSILRIGKKSLVVGTSARSKDGAAYPRFVQDGTPKMAARPFWLITGPIIKQIINTVDAEIIRKEKNP